MSRLPVLMGGLWLALCGAVQAGEVTVSAASSLTPALRELAPLFEAAHPGIRMRLNFGASGALVAQIGKGAPVDVLVCADAESMDRAQSQGWVRPELRRDVVTNTLVLVVPRAASRVPQALDELARPGFERITLGLAASVPAGRYARTALDAAGLWPAVEPKVVGATTARQALDYVARGEVDAGFVFATDAALLPDKIRVAFSVPTPMPIRYPAALVTHSPNPSEAVKFLHFLTTPSAQAVFQRHGFGKP